MKKTVVIFEGLDGFNELKGEWLLLSRRCARHFLHYPFWYGAQLSCYADQHPCVYFMAVYQEERLIAVIPLEYSVFKKKCLKLFIFQLFYSNEMGVCDITAETSLVDFQGVILDAIKQLKKSSPFIRLQSIPETLRSEEYPIALGSSSTEELSHYSKFVAFADGYDAFMAGYNSKFRRNLKRKVTKAKEAGELRFVCAKTPEELRLAFDTFLAVEGSGWKGRDGTSIEAQPQKKAYYQYMLEHFCEENICQINMLYLGDKCVAAQFGVLVDKTVFLLKIGYDEAFSDVSPGHILLEELIRYGSETSLFDKVSFVTGIGWADRWKPQLQKVNNSYFCGGNLIGSLIVKYIKYINR